MKKIVYLQIDLRYSPFLLESFYKELTYLEWILNRIKMIKADNVVCKLFSCQENEKLVSVLDKSQVEVSFSSIEDVTERFVFMAKELIDNKEDALIIRVTSEDILLDVDGIKETVLAMESDGCEWFWNQHGDRTIPDIVSAKAMVARKELVEKQSRYYNALKQDKSIKRYEKVCNKLPVKIPISNTKAFHRVKKLFELYEWNENKIIEAMHWIVEQLFREESYLSQNNWYETMFRAFGKNYLNVDNPKPWFSHSFIYYIEPKIQKEWKIFEWGSGNSTLFWQERVAQLTTVEHDKEWFDAISKIVNRDVRISNIQLTDDNAYAKEIKKYKNEFDIIVIDGRQRVQCAMNCIDALKPDGIIIWDNAERECYKEGYDYLLESGFKRLDFYGAISWSNYIDVTSIFYRENNILNI